MHLVDEVHLHPPARGHVLGVVDQFAHVVHAGVAGGVDLEQVDEAAGVDVAAGVALPARIGRGALLDEVTVKASSWAWGVGWAVLALVLGFIFFWRAEEEYARG